MSKRIIIRADASALIGTGHVMRCLTLADELRAFGFEVTFVCRMLEGNLIEYIERRGYSVIRIVDSSPLTEHNTESEIQHLIGVFNHFDSTPDWLVVDHYGIDKRWEQKVRPFFGRILVIDDLANRAHDCDLLLDQNYDADMDRRYANLIPNTCRPFLGPAYLLLTPSFHTVRRELRKRDGTIRRLLVFFGGSDPTNETVTFLEALERLMLRDMDVDIIIGQANQRKDQIEQLCARFHNVQLHIQIGNMAEKIAAADFALGAGGVAMWERCYLGLPSAVTIVADNQRESVSAAAEYGALWNMGWHEKVNADRYADIILQALNSPKQLINMGDKALTLMSGREPTEHHHVIAAMLEGEFG